LQKPPIKIADWSFFDPGMAKFFLIETRQVIISNLYSNFELPEYYSKSDDTEIIKL